MLRECTLEDISDGRLYNLNDMVKADAGNCENCHKCCTGMGSSIVLDPLDISRLKNVKNMSFQELLNHGFIELNMVDGLILPNLRMNDRDTCSFLNEEGRCSVHANRPGICRIFPLGRVYSETDYSYFLQKDECVKKNLSKIKVKKWIDTANLQENHDFILEWHRMIRKAGELNIELRNKGMGDKINEIAMFVLNEFFVKDISFEDEAQFYENIKLRMEHAKSILF